MKLKDRIQELGEINIGFDISLAEEKLIKINILLTDLETSLFKDVCSFSRDDIINFLHIFYGISYEIGYTKQYLKSNLDADIAKRILPIARLIFGKSKNLLPFLTLNLHNSIQNKELYSLLEVEISDINNTV